MSEPGHIEDEFYNLSANYEDLTNSLRAFFEEMERCACEGCREAIVRLRKKHDLEDGDL